MWLQQINWMKWERIFFCKEGQDITSRFHQRKFHHISWTQSHSPLAHPLSSVAKWKILWDGILSTDINTWASASQRRTRESRRARIAGFCGTGTAAASTSPQQYSECPNWWGNLLCRCRFWACLPLPRTHFIRDTIRQGLPWHGFERLLMQQQCNQILSSHSKWSILQQDAYGTHPQ